jgi:S1-C subfamily serine protease
MAGYFLHRLDGRMAGPFPGDHLLRLCSEGRAFADESIASESQPGQIRPLSAIAKLGDALSAGTAARSSRSAKTVPVVAGELKRSVVQIRTPTGSGSGFAVDPDGTIVTNRHVVDDSSTCTVSFDTGAISPGVVLFRSPNADFAVVRVALPTPEFMCLSERRGDHVAVGEQVIALGFPQDAGFNVTVGIVSALRVRVSPKDSEEHSRHEWVRTSAEINGGNSGGPLVDLHGNLVGMACWGIVADGRGMPVAGMNYCIPHAILCREARQYRRAVSEGSIRVPEADEILRGSHQPDAWDELDLAVSLMCSRYRMRVAKQVPVPGMNRGFHHASLVSSAGDRVDVYVDSFVFQNGPPYVTIYCPVGELPTEVLRDAKALQGILEQNARLPHWNFALKDGRLVLRYQRELSLLDAVEVLNAVQDLIIVLKGIASGD